MWCFSTSLNRFTVTVTPLTCLQILIYTIYFFRFTVCVFFFFFSFLQLSSLLLSFMIVFIAASCLMYGEILDGQVRCSQGEEEVGDSSDRGRCKPTTEEAFVRLPSDAQLSIFFFLSWQEQQRTRERNHIATRVLHCCQICLT